jgi:putative ABC transport system permease protein
METARQNGLPLDEARMKQRKRDREIDEEIAEHLAREIELRVERGASRAQAEAEARKIFGNATRVKENTRGIWAAKLFEQFSFDIRYALRSLAKSPAFTLAALATLALGIGLNTAIFSTVNSVLLRPLPYRDPQRLMQLWETHPAIHSAQVAYPDFADWRSQTKTFEQVAAYTFQGLQQFNLVVNGEPEQIDASLVSGNLLPTLGLQPSLGRNFTDGEMQPGRDDVVLLSDSLWRRRFHANPRIVGQSIQIDGALNRVVGVLPPDTPIPSWADLLVPISRLNKADLTSRKHHQLEVIGRMKSGATESQAQAELSGIAKRLECAYPATNRSIGVSLLPLAEQLTGPVRTPLLILLGAVGFILLIACANVANLLLARAIVRRKEISLRLTLGATRARLMAQLLTESLLLAALGAAFGTLLAFAGTNLLHLYAARELPRAAAISLDARVLLFTLAVATLSSLLCGLLPALEASRSDHNAILKETSRSSLGDSGLRGMRRILVAGEVALALVVLAGAGLLVRSFTSLLSVDLGFRPGHLLTFQINPSPAKYRTAAEVRTFYERILSGMQSLPSVEQAATVYPLPFTSLLNRTRFLLQGVPPPEAGRFPIAQVRVVSPAYFPLMSITIRQGRNFSMQDTQPDVAPACIVSEAFARRYSPDRDALGRKVVLGVVDPKQVTIPIVGVAADIRDLDPSREPEPLLYFPGIAGSIVMRTSAPPLSLANAARRVVASIDPEQPVAAISSMDGLVAAALARRRFSTILLGGFSLLALFLAAIGLYGIVSYSVAQRTRELGLRMALGAQRGRLFRSVLAESLLLSSAGLVAGVILSFFLTRLLSSLLFGVTATDPLTFCIVCAVMLTVAICAALLPAHRAISIDPMQALRQE